MGGSWGVLAANTEKERGEPVFCDPLGAVLAASWAVLAASWGHLSGLGGLLGASWAVLGRLGTLLSRLKTDVKIDQKIDAFQDRFLK